MYLVISYLSPLAHFHRLTIVKERSREGWAATNRNKVNQVGFRDRSVLKGRKRERTLPWQLSHETFVGNRENYNSRKCWLGRGKKHKKKKRKKKRRRKRRRRSTKKSEDFSSRLYEFQPLETECPYTYLCTFVCTSFRAKSRDCLDPSIFSIHDLSSRDEVKLKRVIEERSFVFRVFVRINPEECRYLGKYAQVFARFSPASLLLIENETFFRNDDLKYCTNITENL